MKIKLNAARFNPGKLVAGACLAAALSVGAAGVAGAMSADDAADAAAEEYVDPAYTLEDADWVPGAGEAGADDGAIVIEVEWDGIESMDTPVVPITEESLAPLGDPAHPELK
jgi:hypothetical protein